MSPRKCLTDFYAPADSAPNLAAMLDEAGLELWQAPEGFWAIRVKQAAPAVAHERGRRRRAEGQT